jgi:hypothetical protein
MLYGTKDDGGGGGAVIGECVVLVVVVGLRMRQLELNHFWIFAYLLLLIEGAS